VPPRAGAAGNKAAVSIPLGPLRRAMGGRPMAEGKTFDGGGKPKTWRTFFPGDLPCRDPEEMFNGGFAAPPLFQGAGPPDNGPIPVSALSRRPRVRAQRRAESLRLPHIRLDRALSVPGSETDCNEGEGAKKGGEKRRIGGPGDLSTQARTIRDVVVIDVMDFSDDTGRQPCPRHGGFFSFFSRLIGPEERSGRWLPVPIDEPLVPGGAAGFAGATAVFAAGSEDLVLPGHGLGISTSRICLRGSAKASAFLGPPSRFASAPRLALMSWSWGARKPYGGFLARLATIRETASARRRRVCFSDDPPRKPKSRGGPGPGSSSRTQNPQTGARRAAYRTTPSSISSTGRGRPMIQSLVR